MAERVFCHIGLPKTATTYLQTVMWASREQMRDEGVLLPGDERRDHLWASRVVMSQGGPGLSAPTAAGARKRETAWHRLQEEIAAWPGAAVISHEFFASASAEQAAAMVTALAPAEVHVVTTAREPLGLFTASWQESLKNRGQQAMADYSRASSDKPGNIWNWRTLDLREVLQRWSTAVSPERVHVLPLPGKDAPRDEIWHRFAGLVGLTSTAYDLSTTFPNESMGVAEAETMLRVNRRLEGFTRAWDRGVWLRTYLADERLVPRHGERFWPEPDRIEECRERGRAAAAYVVEQGFDVIGEVDDLLVPEELPRRRTPGSVTEAEVAEVAVDLVARMLHDVRDRTREAQRLRAELEAARSLPVVGPVVARTGRIRRLAQRVGARLRRG